MNDYPPQKLTDESRFRAQQRMQLANLTFRRHPFESLL
jgi:hypothetical protein